MAGNEVSHRLRLMHHRMIIKISNLEILLAKKESDSQSILKKVLLQALMNKKREK